MMNVAIVILILILAKIEVKAYESRMPLYNRIPLSLNNRPASNLALQHHITVLKKPCLFMDCLVYPVDSNHNSMTNIDRNVHSVSRLKPHEIEYGKISPSIDQLPFRRMIDQRNNFNMIPPLHGRLDGYVSHNPDYPSSIANNKLNMKLNNLPAKQNKVVQVTTELSKDMHLSINSSKENLKEVEVTVTTAAIDVQTSTFENSSLEATASEKFTRSLDSFERRFYATTLSKLYLISPPARRENGISFVQSGLFLQLALMVLSTEVGLETRREIDDCLRLDVSDQERLDLIKATVSSLPASSDDLKFRWSSRLVLRSQAVSEQFRTDAAPALHLLIDTFNGTETPKEMADALNHMVEVDSGGAIHNTFEEDELSSDVRAVLVSTLYLRARWRSAPTLLNGTRAFRDAAAAPRRAARMIRLNDRMGYADLKQLDAEALEIFYSTPGLSLVLLVPRGSSLRQLAAAATDTSLDGITAKMQTLRVAATLPLYTLRMTLLLPNKLQAMNVSRLVEANNGSESELRLSLAVQRIMFWAEAGRNAFKDDGLEWDEPPQREVIVDRPYIFYVRWQNKTIMNGNFVL